MTPRFHLSRRKTSPRATQGVLLDLSYKTPRQLCDTLERGPGTNRPGVDRIPEGVFRLGLRTQGGVNARYRKRYGDEFHDGMVEVLDVPGRTYILFHRGNFFTDSLGCILLGSGVWTDSDGELAVANSDATYKRVYPILRDAIKKSGGTSLLITNEIG